MAAPVVKMIHKTALETSKNTEKQPRLRCLQVNQTEGVFQQEH